VFCFEPNSGLLKTNYIKENSKRAYCGLIEVYDFLTDSIKYERQNDVGELIARIFVNNENHFYVEGEGALGFMYNDFAGQLLTEEKIIEIIEQCVLRSIEVDLWSPPFKEVKFVPLGYMLTRGGNTPGITTKRMGFELNSNNTVSESKEPK